jgi:NDP-sugar pyrophosphorylase family protein
MRAGILAAGFGARLGASSQRPKGLTVVHGRPLIEWVLQEFARAGVSDVLIIINEQASPLREHVDRLTADPEYRAGFAGPPPVRWIIETTPSSMHSFLRVVETLADDGDDGPFLISTVDTIARPGTFAAFVAQCGRMPRADVILALSSLVDDENPLRIELTDDGSRRLRAFGTGPYVTAGYYLVRASVLREARVARDAPLDALRLFLAHLFHSGYSLLGVPMPDSVDVDRPSDIDAAERLLRTAS